MLKAAGAVFLLLGALGFSACLCREQKSRIIQLKEMQRMYELLQNEIRYTRLPLPEIFILLSKKVGEPFAAALAGAGKELEEKEGSSLKEAWERNMKKALSQIRLSGEQKMLLLHFPESTGIRESEGQAKALERFIKELEQWIIKAQEEEKNKNKVIMSLGMAGGAFLVILLL